LASLLLFEDLPPVSFRAPALTLSMGLCGLLAAPPLRAQLPPLPSAPLTDAYFAWSDGHYDVALADYLRTLDASRDPGIVEEIAVLTGELYHTWEVTADGRNVAVSPDGAWLTYERQTTEGVETYLVQVDDGQPSQRAILPGSRAKVGGIAPSVAWLTRPRGPEMAQAMAQLEQARQRQSSLEFAAARDRLRWIEVSTASLRIGPVDDPQGGVALDLAGVVPVDWMFTADGTFLLLGSVPGDPQSTGIYRAVGATVERLDDLPGFKSDLRGSTGGFVAFTVPEANPAPLPPGQARPPLAEAAVGMLDLATGQGRIVPGTSPAISEDGSRVAFLRAAAEGGGATLWVATTLTGEPMQVFASDAPMGAPALSPDGSLVTYARQVDADWEVYVSASDGRGGEQRLTSEIQHDIRPQFVSRGTVMALKGESRHRRAYFYDLASKRPLKLFDNNRVRTIAPEYEWVVAPGAAWMAVVAERDGDTVSPERGVYVIDLNRKVTKEELLSRLQQDLDRELALRTFADSLVAPWDDHIRPLTQAVSTARVHEHARVLAGMGSKYVTEPGNARAVQYLVETLRTFGYSPTVQEFEALPGARSSNVIATLPGTLQPEVVYVISSHFDSSRRGPGADDNSSGTTALLEIARVLANEPQPATIEFAFFTGEEAGLLGSRHYVQDALNNGMMLAGALNNDMVGWRNDHRLDNTIRYSNPGIRDLQHAAALRFTGLITYDAKYYKNTDAHAYYEAFGDVVGGIGSYPVLGNPHYHQATDRLETVDSWLVAEVARTTLASAILMTNLPARPRGLTLQTLSGGGIRASWEAALERDPMRYRVRVRTPGGDWQEQTTPATSLDLGALPPASELEVRALTEDGRESWDWARVTVE